MAKEWATIKVFCGLLCLISMIVIATVTCEYALFTTYEKAFGFSATEMAVIGAINGIAFAVSLCIVMIMSKRIHVPRAIAIATFTIGIATFLQVLPYFYGSGRGGISDKSNSSSIYDENAPLCHSDDSLQEKWDRCDKTNSTIGVTPKRTITPEMILFLVTGLMRMTMVPMYSILTTPYIDNHVPHGQSAVFITYFRIVVSIGPVIGMAFGSYLSTIPLDAAFDGLTPKDPQFIGAWWMGDLIFSPAIILASLPMFFYPRHPHGWEGSASRPDDLAAAKCCSTLREFFGEIWSILKNRMYLWAYFGNLISGLGGSGLGLFLPKTLEHQFGYPAWQATLYIGVAFGLGGSVGSSINGFLIKKLKMKPPAMALHIMITKAAIIAVVSCMIFVTCPPAPIESVDVTGSSNLTTGCNSACSCGREAFAPVCAVDGKTYFSPCHAGCHGRIGKDDEVFFSNCACVNLSSSLSSSAEEGSFAASMGFCQRPFCAKSAVYLTLLIIWMIVSASNDTSGMLFKYRAILDDQKAIASGFGQISSSILRGAFSGLVVGRLIDATCAIWKSQCGAQKHCFIYDMKRYHFLVHILLIIFTLPSILCYIGAYLESRKRKWDHLDKRESEKPERNGEAMEERELFVNNNNNATTLVQSVAK